MGALKKRGNVWWIRYSRNGKRYEESSHSSKQGDARTLLQLREGDAARGAPINPRVGRIIFEEGVQAVVDDYAANGKRSLDLLKKRIRKHLKPIFAGRRLSGIATADLRAYITHRQRQGAANATINRELAILRRAFVLAMHDGQLFTRPHFPTLKESAPRSGFFDDASFKAVRRHLPEDLRGVVTFAFITGWRIRSEVLALTWRQVDFAAGTVRLDPGATKTGEARVFPFTKELRAVLEEQRARVREVERSLGKVVPHVWCWLESRRSKVPGAPIRDFRGAWRAACKAAGVPGRVPHDFRRSSIRTMVQRGVPERVAMTLAGHRTRTVFDRYAIVSQTDLATAVAKLDGTGAAEGAPAKAGAKATPGA
jgi:integrase